MIAGRLDDVAICPICSGALPCYGAGLSRREMEAFTREQPAENCRRVDLHVLAAVERGSAEGITEYGIAVALGVDPTGLDNTQLLEIGPKGRARLRRGRLL